MIPGGRAESESTSLALGGGEAARMSGLPSGSAIAGGRGRRGATGWPAVLRPILSAAVAGVIVIVATGTAHAGLARFEIAPAEPLVVNPGEVIAFSVLEDFEPFRSWHYYAGESEPAPVFFGSQSWYHGGEEMRYETVGQLDFHAWASDGQSRKATIYATDAVWRFDLRFTAPGNYTVNAGGTWHGAWNVWYSSSTSHRDCFLFICGPWSEDATHYSNSDPISGDFPTRVVQVMVVPEPETWVLMSGGLGILGALSRRRRPGA